ncbi:MAG: lytic transglycosylase domain-containing protein, partial [Treponema sp.]|nr:lytic transglycosylase domain-containing protein [Treponema sp.]
RLILSNAEAFKVPPSLAFALCWEESRFKTSAVNRANENSTVDRGLFQLNGASFPKLKEADFFDPKQNVYYGISHLKWCLDTGGSEAAGLAMYNAGTVKVRDGGTPKRTLDYISSIINNRRRIEESFEDLYMQMKTPYEQLTLANEEAALRENGKWSRLTLLGGQRGF